MARHITWFALAVLVCLPNTLGIGRELGSDTVTLLAEERQHLIGPPVVDQDVTLTFPEGAVTVGGRLRYQWKGSGILTYEHPGRHERVGGAPGGYGRVEDRLCVQVKCGRAESGDVLCEGEAVITAMASTPANSQSSN